MSLSSDMTFERFSVLVDGCPSVAGAYVGWARDEIKALNEVVARLKKENDSLKSQITEKLISGSTGVFSGTTQK